MRNAARRPVLPLCWLLLAGLVLLGGCSVAQSSRSVNLDLDLASQPTFFVNNWVEKSPVQLFVYPTAPPDEPPKALFMPLRLTQRMENAVTVGHNVSRLIWQSWLQAQVLPVIEFAYTNTPYRPDLALAMARQKGADLVIGGYITHLLDGGTNGNSEASLALEIYDVKTGNLIWSMAQGGYIQKAKISDYLLFAVKTRMPNDPTTAVLMALGADMGLKVREWIYPKGPEKPWHGMEPKAF